MPFIQAGYRYCGLDLSAAMLAVLAQKLAAAPATPARGHLLIADAMALPFRAGAFDVALAFHVLHLVDDHRQVLREIRRVLRPGGRVVVSTNEYTSRARRDREAGRDATGAPHVTARGNAILDALGMDRSRRRRGQWVPDEEMLASLGELGATAEPAVLVEYQSRPRAAREVVRAHRDRVFSSDWDLPDAIHAEASLRLERWLDTEHPAPDALVSESSTVAVLVGRFSA
jgi:SAM-dependent methyltransferase